MGSHCHHSPVTQLSQGLHVLFSLCGRSNPLEKTLDIMGRGKWRRRRDKRFLDVCPRILDICMYEEAFQTYVHHFKRLLPIALQPLSRSVQ